MVSAPVSALTARVGRRAEGPLGGSSGFQRKKKNTPDFPLEKQGIRCHFIGPSFFLRPNMCV